MPYFPDLTPYSFVTAKEEVTPDLLNVGWLSCLYPYTKGEVDRQVLEKLCELCRTPVRLTRGFHRCDLCRRFPRWLPFARDRRALGNGEIRVPGANGKVYASPALICHYIAKHRYCPPQGFLDAAGNL